MFRAGMSGCSRCWNPHIAQQQSLLAEAHAAGTLADADSSSTGMALTTSPFSAARPLRCSSPTKDTGRMVLMPDGMLGGDAMCNAGPRHRGGRSRVKCSYWRRTFPVYRQRRLYFLPLSALRAAYRKRTSWSKKTKKKTRAYFYVCVALSVTQHLKSSMCCLSHPYA